MPTDGEEISVQQLQILALVLWLSNLLFLLLLSISEYIVITSPLRAAVRSSLSFYVHESET